MERSWTMLFFFGNLINLEISVALLGGTKNNIKKGGKPTHT